MKYALPLSMIFMMAQVGAFASAQKYNPRANVVQGTERAMDEEIHENMLGDRELHEIRELKKGKDEDKSKDKGKDNDKDKDKAKGDEDDEENDSGKKKDKKTKDNKDNGDTDAAETGKQKKTTNRALPPGASIRTLPPGKAPTPNNKNDDVSKVNCDKCCQKCGSNRACLKRCKNGEDYVSNDEPLLPLNLRRKKNP